MKIYTKQGDEGKSLTPFGRKEKSHIYFKVVGGIDEIAAHMGWIHHQLVKLQLPKLIAQSEWIITQLKNLNDDIWLNKSSKQKITQDSVTQLETWIDEMDAMLEPLQAFIPPIGSETFLWINLARVVTRRVEEDYFAYVSTMQVALLGGTWLNRLSDYLFTLSRYCNEYIEKDGQ